MKWAIRRKGHTVNVESVAGLMVGEGYFGISVRKKRANATHGIILLPAASVGMNDTDGIEAVSAFLKSEDIAHWVFRHKTKRYAQINIHGLKRLDKFLPWIRPHLFGAKVACAKNLHDYVLHRLSLPHQSPITREDLDYVKIARSLNGWQGLNRTHDLDELYGILRD